MIDLSAVRPDTTEAEVRATAEMARDYRCICASTLPGHTPLLVDLLADEPEIGVSGNVSFPSRGATNNMKIAEARELLQMGCDELDVVINIGLLRSGQYGRALDDIKGVVETAGQVPVKAILECHFPTTKFAAPESCAYRPGPPSSRLARAGRRRGPVVPISETLHLVPLIPILRHQLFDQVQKTDDRPTCTFEVLNVIRIKMFQHHIHSSDRDRLVTVASSLSKSNCFVYRPYFTLTRPDYQPRGSHSPRFFEKLPLCIICKTVPHRNSKEMMQ